MYRKMFANYHSLEAQFEGKAFFPFLTLFHRSHDHSHLLCDYASYIADEVVLPCASPTT